MRERRRLGRLARSESPIEDPEDRKTLQEWYAYTKWFADTPMRKYSLRYLPWLLVPPVLWLSLVGAWVAAAFFTLVLVTNILSRAWSNRILDRIDRTAKLNGWAANDSGPV
jgi:hypothetical protein